MSAYPGTVLVYVSADSSTDLSAGVMRLGVDGASFPATADYVPNPPPDIAALRPLVDVNRTRYWWSCLCGAGQLVALLDGLSTIHGQLSIGNQLLPYTWPITTSTA